MTENEEDKIEKEIVKTCLERFGKNLATVLIFGSYNTGEFVANQSDIDLIILFKKNNGMKFQKELDILKHRIFVDIKTSIAHFRTLSDYKKHIYHEGTWSSWITVICGSKNIYSTKEFENFRSYLEKHPISSKILKEYLLHKDDIELEGYFKRSSGWNLTKAYFSHIRRKLQILNWLEGNELTFDYDVCLKNIKSLVSEKKLKQLGQIYAERIEISLQESQGYYKLAKDLTEKIIRKLK